MKTKHAVSIFRKFLGICMENCKIQGRSYSFPVTKTRDRAGWHQTGELLTGRRFLSFERRIAGCIFEFCDGGSAAKRGREIYL